MRNAGLEEVQAGIKIARRNINNLRYADDTTLMAESEEKLKSLLRSQDGGGVGRGEHFLPHKFIKRAFKRRVNSTKQLLNAGRGHQAPRKATQLFERR